MQLQVIESKIFEVRGQKIMLDFALAEMYETETKYLKRAVNKLLLFLVEKKYLCIRILCTK